MVKHLDFMLYSDSDKRIKFRFYPRRSHMHSFNDLPPKNFEEVYKTYYSWAIFTSYNDAFDSEEPSWSLWEKIFDIKYDERSSLEFLGDVIRKAINEGERTEYIAYSLPGAEWTIKYRRCDWCFADNEEVQSDSLLFIVFDYYTDKGFRFGLNIKESEAFAEYLDHVNQYMLEHGEAI